MSHDDAKLKLHLPAGQLSLHNVFLGSSAFLICGGPPLASHNLDKLGQRGILTCSVNNAAAVVRTQLWVSVDHPSHFVEAVWRDPAIWKFTHVSHFQSPIRRDQPQQLVHMMPAVFGYRRNATFDASTWLSEPIFNWGNADSSTDSDGNQGSRSVMLVAVKLLFYLGVRRLYLLGCDFRMDRGRDNYAFARARSRGSVASNNRSYRVLNARFAALTPYFQSAGLEVYNCTPNSGLVAFPYMPFEQAIDATAFTRDIDTAGMYDQRREDPGEA